MRIVKFIVSISIFLSLVYFLGTGHTFGSTSIPPLGMFLDPFQGYLQNGAQADNHLNEDLQLDALSEEVSISYDENMVPHISAQNDNDLYTAQGYLVAKFRLWQMELQARSASGTLAEVLPAAINRDRESRRKGMVWGAEKIILNLQNEHPEVWNSIESYAKGVNAYINSLSYKEYPIEYKLLDYAPKQWKAENTVFLIQYMNDMLGGYDTDIENTNFVSLFGRELYDFLFFSNYEEPVIPDQEWDFSTLEITPDSIQYESYAIDNIPVSNPDNGSNNWAISGAKTESGRPILSNDPHLRMSLPSLWNMMHLQSPDMNVAGFVFSGAPGIIIGFNDSIAWGVTNAPRDQRDWYKVKFKDENKTEYWHDDQWKVTRMRIEEIAIKGSDPFVDTVYYTHHGPLMFDNNFPGNRSRQNLAFQWIGHEPSGVVTAIYRLNRAKNYTEYASALQFWDSPAQNVVFASTNGDIALRVEGTFPLKWKDQGRFVMDGSNPAHDWQGYIPHEQNVFQLNPERQFVSSANQITTGPSYPYYIYNAQNEMNRNRIINRLLTDLDSAGVEDIMKIQLNVFNVEAEEVVPFLLDSIKYELLSDEDRDAVESLRQWDFNYSPDSSYPVLYEFWWRRLQNMLWDEIRNENYRVVFPPSNNTYFLMKEALIDSFADRLETPQKETMRDIITLSLQQSLNVMRKREKEANTTLNWNIANNVVLRHMSTLIPAFDSERLPIGGSGDVIMAANGDHGPSMRMVVEMNDPPRAYAIFPGGLSGNPGSKFYMNYVADYTQGKYVSLSINNDSRAAKYVQKLTPVSK